MTENGSHACQFLLASILNPRKIFLLSQGNPQYLPLILQVIRNGHEFMKFIHLSGSKEGAPADG